MTRRAPSNPVVVKQGRTQADRAADRREPAAHDRRFVELDGKRQGVVGAADKGPADGLDGLPESRPFEIGDDDAPQRTREHGIGDNGIGERRNIAVALQPRLDEIDAARDIDRQDKFEIDRLGGQGRRGPQQSHCQTG